MSSNQGELEGERSCNIALKGYGTYTYKCIELVFLKHKQR